MKLQKLKDRNCFYVLGFVYRRDSDCTNNGISSKFDCFKVYFADKDGVETDLTTLPDDSLILVKDVTMGCERIRALPVDALLNDGKDGRPHKWFMDGGNFIYTSDAPFSEYTQIYAAIPIHDRYEPW